MASKKISKNMQKVDDKAEPPSKDKNNALHNDRDDEEEEEEELIIRKKGRRRLPVMLAVFEIQEQDLELVFEKSFTRFRNHITNLADSAHQIMFITINARIRKKIAERIKMKQAFTFVIDGETRQKRQEVLMTTIEKNIGNKIELKDSIFIGDLLRAEDKGLPLTFGTYTTLSEYFKKRIISHNSHERLQGNAKQDEKLKTKIARLAKEKKESAHKEDANAKALKNKATLANEKEKPKNSKKRDEIEQEDREEKIVIKRPRGRPRKVKSAEGAEPVVSKRVKKEQQAKDKTQKNKISSASDAKLISEFDIEEEDQESEDELQTLRKENLTKVFENEDMMRNTIPRTIDKAQHAHGLNLLFTDEKLDTNGKKETIITENDFCPSIGNFISLGGSDKDISDFEFNLDENDLSSQKGLQGESAKGSNDDMVIETVKNTSKSKPEHQLKSKDVRSKYMLVEDPVIYYRQLKDIAGSITQKLRESMDAIINKDSESTIQPLDNGELTDEPRSPMSVSDVIILSPRKELKSVPAPQATLIDLQEKEVLEDRLLNKLLAHTQVNEDMFETIKDVDLTKVANIFSNFAPHGSIQKKNFDY